MVLLWMLFPLAYLLGSIPSAVWMGKGFRGIDLRRHGSGNAGATNAFRVLGIPIGVAVLIADMLKGFLAVSLSELQHVFISGSQGWYGLRVLLGILAVTGHVFPVFAHFRGGKGVATLAGIGLALHPLSALCALGVYVLIFLVTRISSAGSLAAVLSYPLWMIWVFHTEMRYLWYFSILVPLLVILTHRSNIVRLFRGKEA